MGIKVENITKHFGGYTALNGVDLDVHEGELVALLGPSGSGKTTLLRIIAGLEAPDSGSIYFYGEETTHRRVRERKVGFVFQHYALFRHMTVFDNIAFGLTIKPRCERPDKSHIQKRVNELLHLIQLENMADRYPSQLSGGQRQRVALARALATEPKVLLLDEPFGALDAKVRHELRRWLRRLHDEIHVTSIFVTHDQEEALEVADRVVVMNQAQIEQIGTPEDVYENPATPFVFNFLGKVNLFHCRDGEGNPHKGPDGKTVGYVRPSDIHIFRDAETPDDLSAEVILIQSAGALPCIELKRDDNGAMVQVEIPRERYRALQLNVGEKVFIRPQNIRTFQTE